MENENETFTIEILQRLESLAVTLYNKVDYDSAESVCNIMQEIYINQNNASEAKRIENIIKKLHIIRNYMETNRDIFIGSKIPQDSEIEEQSEDS